MIVEVGPHESFVPGPIEFGIRRRMDSDKSSAALDESFKCGLLHAVKDVSRRIEEDHCPVLRQTSVGENFRVFAGVDMEIAEGSECANGGDAGSNRVVPVCRSLREHQDGKRRFSGLRTDRAEREGQKHDGESRHQGFA